MVQFVNATQARGEIERILTKAKYNMVMISPYIKINDDFIARLMDAGLNRKVRITMVCREQDLLAGQRVKLKQTPNLALHFNERIHAKCFYNEDTMVITSLNLYESLSGPNREMGVLLSSNTEGDKVAFDEAKAEAQFIIRESESDTSKLKTLTNERSQTPILKEKPNPKVETKPAKETSIEASIVKGISEFFGLKGIKSARDLPAENTSMKVRSSSRTKQKGYCIRCGKNKTYDLDAPYCPDCYRVWNKFKDPNYKEEFCHLCGTPNQPTTRNKPLCNSCYNKSLRK